MSGPQPPAEFSRLVVADRLGVEGIEVAIEATADECRRLAARLGVVAVDSLTGRASVWRLGESNVFRLRCRMRADVVQECVVTLEPVRSQVAEQFERSYSAAAAALDVEVELDPLDDDPPDPLVAGAVDVGEAMAEQLALSIDPYPRKPGAKFAAEDIAEAKAAGGNQDAGSPAGDTPFAALKQWPQRSRG
jgi:uncharacterized metal-binding protein YceD (DUF177 family)